METALIALAVMAGLVYAVAPLFAPKGPGPGPVAGEAERFELEDLELDYATGKLTREDYERERKKILED